MGDILCRRRGGGGRGRGGGGVGGVKEGDEVLGNEELHGFAGSVGAGCFFAQEWGCEGAKGGRAAGGDGAGAGKTGPEKGLFLIDWPPTRGGGVVVLGVGYGRRGIVSFFFLLGLGVI